MKYQTFIFKDRQFDQATKTLNLYYSLDNQLDFTETYKFNFDYTHYDEASFDRACQSLFLMAGVSYYKTYIPSQIDLGKEKIDQATANFLCKTYQSGLGEFFYVNKLDPKTPIPFPATSETIAPTRTQSNSGLLIAIGGGKDSLVTVELLRSQPKVATWSLNHRTQLEPLVQRIGLKHFWVERTWDQKLFDLNKQDALNGHIPISAIFACVGAVVAVLTGYRDIVVSNESSASEPNLVYKDVEINHQYSKSIQFERGFQQNLEHLFGSSIRYYSFLRPITEVRVAEIFAKIGFDKYKGVFSSCNRAFVHASNHMFWDGTCPKCAFVFLVLTPFVDRQKLEALFSGKNLLLDNELEVTYRQLLGIKGDKPLECVGEVKESREAMNMAKNIYSQLNDKYNYDIPADYSYKSLSTHSMPTEIAEIFNSAIKNF